LGNWRVAGINSFQTGDPINVLTGQDISLTGTNNDRPNLAGDPVLPGGRSKSAEISQWFNTAAFVYNLTGQLGNVGRNILTGPGSWNWDLSAQKILTYHERHRVEFRAEFFNTLNHANLNDPGATLTSTKSFGKITGTSNPRNVQFVVRYQF
jgi:hypothetical protein